MTLTALVLSPEPVAVPPSLPAGVCMLNHCERFTTTEGIHMARRRAMAKVFTEWVFWLDSDDELPPDAASVLEQCIGAGRPLAYTDEIVIHPDGRRQLRRSHAHNLAAHAVSPMLVHHLAVMRTEHALEALEVIPTGDVWIEHPLFWQMARRGAAYIPRVGYHWHKGETGMHRAPGILAAQVRGARWCVAELGDPLAASRAMGGLEV